MYSSFVYTYNTLQIHFITADTRKLRADNCGAFDTGAKPVVSSNTIDPFPAVILYMTCKIYS